jgi:hypothetical protein
MGTFAPLPTKNDHWKSLWEKYKLTDDQLHIYKRDGFLSGFEIFTRDECDALLEEVMEVIADVYPGRGLFGEFHKNETEDPEMAVCHGLGHWRCTKGLHDIIYHPAITIKASQLVVEDSGFAPRSVRFWHYHLFLKPPKCWSNVAWHQDYS